MTTSCMLSYRFNFFNLSYLDILKSPVATEVTIEVCDGVKCSRDIPHCEHVSPLTSAASTTSMSAPAPASTHLGWGLVTHSIK